MILEKIAEAIAEKDARYAKALSKYMATWDAGYRDNAEHFLNGYFRFLDSRGIDFDFAVDSLLFLVEEMVVQQFEFVRTGSYRLKTFQEADRHVYSDGAYMKKYMIGLALSQYFWKNHYEIFKYYLACILSNKTGGSFLEIGPGHGIFLLEALRNTHYNTYTALDISSESLDLTKNLIRYVRPDLYDRVDFINAEIEGHPITQSYDFITMGEVLEHLESPETVLRKLCECLSNRGRFFVSTCANSPAVDHIHLFNDIDEIREMLGRCGFAVESEAVLPLNNYSLETALAKKLSISYCALLKKN